MDFNAALVAVVTGTDQVNLARLVNSWLRRRLDGALDDLLIVGRGYEAVEKLTSQLASLGLVPGETIAVDVIDIDAEDQDGEVAQLANSWVAARHGDAIPVAFWQEHMGGIAYPADVVWWLGISVASTRDGALDDVLADLVPASFRPQARTWAALLEQQMGVELGGTALNEHEAALAILGLARWLQGFSASTDNTFYAFDLSDALRSCDYIDDARLAFEAAELENSVDHDEEDIRPACLDVCLAQRNDVVRDALADFFGGDAGLFWATYSSIWPKREQPMDEEVEALLSSSSALYRDLEKPWNFVCNGWADIEK